MSDGAVKIPKGGSAVYSRPGASAGYGVFPGAHASSDAVLQSVCYYIFSFIFIENINIILFFF